MFTGGGGAVEGGIGSANDVNDVDVDIERTVWYLMRNFIKCK